MDSTIVLPIDSQDSLVLIKDKVELIWKEQSKLANLRISQENLSDVARFFTSEHSKQALSKVCKTKFWTLPNSNKSSDPVRTTTSNTTITSKIYGLLFPSQECPAVASSFEILRNVQHAYNELTKISQAQAKKKTAIAKQLESVLNDTIVFTTNTLTRLFVRSTDSQLFEDMFMRENYYTSINFIRVFEFSILDLLELPEKYQSTLVCPLETTLANWKSSASFDPDFLKQNFLSSLVSSYQSTYNLALTPEESNSSVWPNSLLIKRHYEFISNSTGAQLFNCGNHESCHQRETKPRSFAKCSRCKIMRYCSKVCQQTHWKMKHKNECCKELKEEDLENLFKGRRIIIGAESDVTSPQTTDQPQ